MGGLFINSAFNLSLVSFFAGLILSGCGTEKAADKPNIIYILADDLGYGELGCYGQGKIETPNIDELASKGMRFTQHYAGSPVCAPSRCVLLTGMHTGHAPVRGNDAMPERGKVRDYLAILEDPRLEGQRPMPGNTMTVGKLLKNAGYRTGMVGKWGLGPPLSESIPNKMGFDFYYGYVCQYQAHTYYPLHLYKNEDRVYLNNDTVIPHELLDPGADPWSEESYSKYTSNQYSVDLMFEELTDFVEESSDGPFFLYWATPVPHAPLQAPKKWIDYYVKKFGDEEPYPGDKSYYPQRYPHACYAAMISYFDEQVGKLIRQLKDLGQYENTLIIFSSDNGPTYNGGTDSPWFDSARPFRSEFGFGKGFLREGGIRVPMIAQWPDRIKEGSESGHISAFYDVLPTLCEVAGIDPGYKTDGISFLPTLLGKGQQKEHEFLYWEFPASGGQQAVRMGKWKAIRENIFKDSLQIKLFNLETDKGEMNDVSDSNQDIVDVIETIFRDEHTPSEIERFAFKQLGD